MQKKQTRLAGIILAICCILAVIVFFQTRPDTTVGEKKITISESRRIFFSSFNKTFVVKKQEKPVSGSSCRYH